MNANVKKNQILWEQRYAHNEAVNRYPYDHVVSFILRAYGKETRRNIKILDYGCGGGNHCYFLGREGFDCYGLDYSPSAVDITRKMMIDNGMEADPQKIVCGQFSSLPFPENFFDAIIDRQSLDQNSADIIPSLIAEIFRVLKPGGRYFGINFADRHPTLKFGRHLGCGDYADFSHGPLKGLGSRHFFSVNELYNLFNSFDIEDVKISSVHSLKNSDQGSEEFILIAAKPC